MITTKLVTHLKWQPHQRVNELHNANIQYIGNSRILDDETNDD